jgi:hypothetical protein
MLSTARCPPPDDDPSTSISAVSPVIANGWPKTLMLAAADVEGRFVAVVTAGARWHSWEAWYVDANSASGSLACAQLIVV